MAIDFSTVFARLEEWGVYEVLLPFLLVAVITYAILERVQLFGPKSSRINWIIAIVLGVLLVRQGDLVTFINMYLPHVSTVIVVFLGFLILLGLFGFGSSNMRGGIMILFVLLSLGGGIWALTNASEHGDFEIPLIGETISEEDAGALVVIGVFLLIVGMAVGYKPKKTGFEGFMQGMNRMGDSFAGVNQR